MDCSMPNFLSFSISQSLLNSCSLCQLCYSTILSPVIPFSCLQSFPASVSFLTNQLFTSGSQSIAASVSAPVPPIAAAAAKSFQLCLTLHPHRHRLPRPWDSPARTLEWVVVSFSSAWKWKVKVKSLSRAQLLATPWTAVHQAPRPWDFPGKSTGMGCHCLLRLQWLLRVYFL